MPKLSCVLVLALAACGSDDEGPAACGLSDPRSGRHAVPAGRHGVVAYSGYGYADPDGGESSIAQLALLLGYAVVDVNMRGTGCSGGAFDYFEPLQGLDGYDVIETVARQPWVAHGHVGMMGISYGDISQLFVGATAPPSLAAITPLSVIDNTATTLYPGGLLNTGFALSWARDRVRDAEPASATGGQRWALERIQGGDQTCKDNQILHAEAVDLLAKIDANRFYNPAVADPLAPVTFVHKIKTPVFLACQFTDEQTGGHCPTLAQRFTGTWRKWFTFTNGTHNGRLRQHRRPGRRRRSERQTRAGAVLLRSTARSGLRHALQARRPWPVRRLGLLHRRLYHQADVMSRTIAVQPRASCELLSRIPVGRQDRNTHSAWRPGDHERASADVQQQRPGDRLE
jgi:X-Pro dipeptidyl-peptidase-like protein